MKNVLYIKFNPPQLKSTLIWPGWWVLMSKPDVFGKDFPLISLQIIKIMKTINFKNVCWQILFNIYELKKNRHK